MKEENESEFADKELIPILEIESNKMCNDCGKMDIHWCSINNSVLLCPVCARTHKKFNPKISKIKSLEVDSWTKEEIALLKLGGNEKFTKMIKSYYIPLTKDNQEYKYYTKAAQYYRDILFAESKNNPINNIPKPSLKEGIEILYKEEYSNLFNKYTNQPNNHISQQENNEIINNVSNNSNNNSAFDNSNSSWLDRMAEKLAPDIDIPNDKNNNLNENYNNNNYNNAYSFDNIANNMLYALNEVKERAKDIDFKEKIKMAGEYVQNKTEIIQNSETFKGLVNTVSTGIDTLMQKTDQFFKNDQINQNVSLQNNANENEELNSPYIKNENNTGIINNIVNKLTQPTFKSNYSSINNDQSDQYINYINQISEKNNDINNTNTNSNSKSNINNINDDKENNEKKNENKEENLDDLQNENDPNQLIMTNTPK